MNDLFSRLVANSVRPRLQSPVGDPLAHDPSLAPQAPASVQAPRTPAPQEETHREPVRHTTHDVVHISRKLVEDEAHREAQPISARRDSASQTSFQQTQRRRAKSLVEASSAESPTQDLPVVAREAAKANSPNAPPVNSSAPSVADAPPTEVNDLRERVVDAEVRTRPPVRSHILGDVPRSHAVDSQPTVRIHIGRLDVRANLNEPSPAQKPREDAKTTSGSKPSLSLDDYLSGRKAAP